ncbi:MAG TPA: D-alanyl-D-alanine carboxypeptidase family protein [Patescibacteria group bacterium]|nr:D-alanyl-D-alanine carboxypeptidase family protein [Patescibacteria group bacterium]
MKTLWTGYSLTVILATGLVAFFYWMNTPLLVTTVKFSPLPTFLTMSDNPQVTSLDIWQPKVLGTNTQTSAISITATSAISYDLTSNKFLFLKNPNQRLPMASLTKIMTAIVALEHPLPSDKYLVKGRDLVGEDSMGLVDGETLSLEELLYGLILHSGNDAAETLADNFPAGRDGFISAMNLKAQTLGLTNTHFTNPTGLEGDGTQYTTAQDLLVMTQYALSHFPEFVKIVGTFDYIIPQTSTHQEYDLENETNLLTSYPGVEGVKTGYTPEAGLCLVTYLNYQNHKIIAVLLGSDDRRGEMKEMLDFSLKTQGIIPPRHL